MMNVLLLYTLFFLPMDTDNCYAVISAKEAIDLAGSIEEVARQSTQIEGSYAYKLVLGDGSILLFPNPLTDEGAVLFFSSNACMEDNLLDVASKARAGDESIVERHQHIIVGCEIGQLARQLLTQRDFDSEDFNPNKQDMSLVVNIVKNEWHLIDDGQKVAATMILGEIVRLEYRAVWGLQKRYGKFIHYYEPVLIYPNGEVLAIFDKALYYWESDMSLDSFRHSVFVKTSPLIIDVNIFEVKHGLSLE